MKHHILIVDDDAEIRETLVELLRDRGYEALGASDGIKAATERMIEIKGQKPDATAADLLSDSVVLESLVVVVDSEQLDQ